MMRRSRRSRFATHTVRPVLLPPFLSAMLLAILLPGLLATPAVARRTYRAESYRTELRVQPDGSLRIREEIRIRFRGGPFTFFYRGLPLRHTDGIVDVVSPDPIEVRPRRARLDVTWRFPEARDTVRTFTVEYVAKGALRLGPQADRLKWIAFPEERAYAIDAGAAAVVLPPGWPAPTHLRTRPGGKDFRALPPPAQAAALLGPADPRSVVLSLAPVALEENRGILLQADLESGYVDAKLPAWQERERLWRDRLPGVLIVASFLLTFGVFWVLWTRAYLVSQLERGTTWSSPAANVFALTSPPDDASPALVGTLTYGIVNAIPILAALFDLARRGIVRFESGPKRFAWSSPQVRLRAGERPTNLPPWETLLLEAVFRKTDADGTANWARAGIEVQKLGSRFLKSVREELVRRGDFDARAMAARRGLYYRGIAIFALALVLFVLAIALLDALGPFGFIPSLAAILAGTTSMIAGATLYPHSAQGAQRARAWRGFAKFLKESGKGNVALDAARFHQWLPYSVALGVAPAWVKAGKRWGLSVPDWFRTPGGDPGDMTALLAVVAVSSSHGGGGGGGAGGGGSSGAG